MLRPLFSKIAGRLLALTSESCDGLARQQSETVWTSQMSFLKLSSPSSRNAKLRLISKRKLSSFHGRSKVVARCWQRDRNRRTCGRVQGTVCFCLHQVAADDTAIQRTAMLIVVTFGLAVASIVVGVIAIIRLAKSNTEFSLLGVKLSTGVAVALVGIGLLLAYFTALWWEF
jgi:hypothetical protein